MLSPLSDIGFLGQRVDFVFYTVLLLSIACFLTGEFFWFVKKHRGSGSKEIQKKHFETVWSLIPLIVLLFLTCVETQFFSPVRLKKVEAVRSKVSSEDISTQNQKVRDTLPKFWRSEKTNKAVRM
jgi:heme/copper-type cytochrome/quinol oxidase subunit 2